MLAPFLLHPHEALLNCTEIYIEFDSLFKSTLALMFDTNNSVFVLC